MSEQSDHPETTTSEEESTTSLREAVQSHSEVLAASRKHTRRSFVVAAAAAAAGYGFFRWATESHGIGMQPWPLRRVFEANAALSHAVFHDRALAPTYALSQAKDLRVNGIFGLKRPLAPESWRLQLVGGSQGHGHPRYTPDVTAWEYRYEIENGHRINAAMKSAARMAPAQEQHQAKTHEELSGRLPRGQEEAGESRSTVMPGTPGLLLTLADVQKLPRHEFVTQFKCIEGWSRIVHWAGVRMADFLEAYPPAPVGGREPRYVYMETPNGNYYTGYDMHTMRHPQTLLATEMMGAPLTQNHGAPLRLHMPTKYGYKQIKRIALIRYMDEKPDDYWTKLGYDWYADL